MKTKLKMVIPNVPGIEVVVSNTAESIAEQMHFSRDKISDISIAVIETLINAFEHGNSENRNVKVDFEINTDSLVIRISDSGKGFDPKVVEKPNISEKLHSSRKRGWGMHLIEKSMDHVKIKSGSTGTTIIMTKKK